MEMAGIPTVLLARTDFLGVIRNAVCGLGFPPETPLVSFPVDLFLPESDLTTVRARRQEFYEALTGWTPSRDYAAAGTGTPLVTVSAETHEQTFDRANALMLASTWGDGLPVRPPTPERVDWILRGTQLPRTQLIGKFPPRGALATVEACAIALAMAGGRPEYLPVLIAAVEAFLDPRSGGQSLQADSGSAYPVVVVNGPISRQIRLNTSFGCLGPDPQRPAGASIGRALRLMQQNLGGALPGVGAMGMWGAMRYTNAVFGEDEAGLPEGWTPHGADRHGYAPGTNCVSLVFATGATNIRRRGFGGESREVDALQGMRRTAKYLRSPNLGCLMGWSRGTPGVLLLSPIVAKAMTELGWTKDSIRTFLWEHTRIPADELALDGIDTWIRLDHDPAVRASIALDPWPMSSRPENLVVIIAGGGHPTNSYWLESYGPEVVGKTISVPDGFDALLKEADRELGCGEEVCMI
ncbi:MAG: hypothetical protein H7125_04305 [Proteobacteria bacterium]|nr:hypothetical protein [Burkholderiales bacterium]